MEWYSTQEMMSGLRNNSKKVVTKDKVENILKGSLDSIPSTSSSVKIQIMGGKLPQVNFPANNLNFY